jgi:hypothetical protein
MCDTSIHDFNKALRLVAVVVTKHSGNTAHQLFLL